MLSLSARAAGLQQRGSEDRIFGDRFLEPTANKIPDSIRILNRLTFGATQELRAEFNALGNTLEERTQNYVEQQLNPRRIDDSVCEGRVQSGQYESLDKSLRQQWSDYERGTVSGEISSIPLRETEAVKIIRTTCSRRQVYERMVDFWHDHFNIFGRVRFIQSVFMHFDRDAIRPHALGNFRELVEATAKSTAMLYYLDNHDSRAGGFNENYARELIELHTMGAEVYFATDDPSEVPVGSDGRPVGYCDNDVYEAARCLTGWTVANGRSHTPGDTGEFFYYSGWHDQDEKEFLGRAIPPNQPPMMDGRVVFDELCSHPATARQLCRKLIRRFIADEPDPALVESAAQVWQQNWQSRDQIKIVLRHILTAENLLRASTPKLRRPFEVIIAALRQTSSPIVPAISRESPWGGFYQRLEGTGQRPFRWGPPDGYPDRAIDWMSASSLGMTWRMLSLLVETGVNSGDPILPIVEPTRQHFPTNQRTARNLVDWWLDRLLGFRPAVNRYEELLDFMRQNAGPDEPLDLDTRLPSGRIRLGDLSASFVPARLRAMVGLIYMLPEFQVR